MAEARDIWEASWRTDPEARVVADRHYNRQSPGAPDFVPPGRCLVLKARDKRAFWITSWPFAEYVKHEWAGAWVCSAFRNENSRSCGRRLLASEMIRAAVAATLWHWTNPPKIWAEDGRGWGGHVAMVTFVNAAKVRRSRTPGRCFIKAGFRPIGFTKGGLVALGIDVDDLPEPSAAAGEQTNLFAEGTSA